MKIAIILLSLCITVTSFAQEKRHEDVSLDALLIETQFMSDDPNTMEMIWWIPFEFWVASNAQDPTTTQDDIDALRELMQGNELFAIVKGKIGYFGGITYTPLEKILEEWKVSLNGDDLSISQPKDISPDLQNFLSMMSPMMTSMFGEMGKNVHFIFMSDDKNKSRFPIKGTSNDVIEFALGAFKKTVQLPLDCLILEKKCPNDGALLSSKWTYCPFHGDTLVQQ